MISNSVKKIVKELEKENLSKEDRVALVTAILDKSCAFPIGSMIEVANGTIAVNGQVLELDQYLSFKEASTVLKDNYARKVINEQLKHKATLMGVHKSNTIEELLFAKAVIWVINEENILIESILNA